jgi:hypothetical protein
MARWLRYTLRPPDVCFVHHPEYAHAAAGALIDPVRPDKILGFLTDEHIIRRADVSRPIPASLENILRVHTPEYLESLSDPEVVSGIMGIPLPARAAQEALDLMRDGWRHHPGDPHGAANGEVRGPPGWRVSPCDPRRGHGLLRVQ